MVERAQFSPARAGIVLLGLLMFGGLAPSARAQPAPGAAAAPQRPQTPRPPFPYKAQDVVIPGAGDARLAGTLTIPAGAGPFPAVLLINGSGPNDRDETILGHKPFLVIADALTRRGVMVLRLDKRGVGASTGGSPDLTTADYAADARAALAWLRRRPEAAAGRLGLLGHSEGAEIAPMLAADDPKVAFLVLLAAPAVPGDQLLLAQSRALLEAQGAPADRVLAAARANRDIYAIAKSDLPEDEAYDQVMARLKEAGAPATAVAAMARQGLSPWVRWFLRHDPRPALAKVRCPVLALYGSKDLQVVPVQNVPELRAALKADPQATVTDLPGLNHLFQTADTGSPRDYGQIQETIAPAALALIVDWVVRTTAAPPAPQVH
jgi:pimeloyl-ACP methyl ester carboxylesterase